MRPIRSAVFLALAGAAVLAAGCSSTRVHRVTEREFAPKESPEQVRLFLGEIETPHEVIAYVNSFPSDTKTSEVKREQLKDLQKRAAELGADAVMDVRQLKEQHRGMTADPAVPFKAWKQGDYELYFLRGVAVRAVEPKEGTPEWEQQQAAAKEAGTTPPAAVESTFNTDRIPVQETGGNNDEPKSDSSPTTTTGRTGY